jgi:60 kDa SS-A/Ro ribonucleoprotein
VLIPPDAAGEWTNKQEAIAMNYAEHFNPKQTPQTEKADPRQVANSAGGFTFQLDKWGRLERWLILGAEGGSYYAGERELTRDNAKTIQECLAEDGARTIAKVVEISDGGRAPKNDPAIFALALAAADPQATTRAAALAALPKVCRIPTHLFQFVGVVDKFRGWGPGLRRAVASWYADKPLQELCYHVAKYQQREGWSHRDVLRQCHAVPAEDRAAVYRYLVAGADQLGTRDVAGKGARKARAYPAVGELPAYLQAFEELKQADEQRTIALIQEHGFTHEMVRSELKNSRDVWAALLEKMPIGAMVRSLAKMTAVGLLSPMSEAARKVCEVVTSQERIRKARLHPITLLSALKVYQQGHGEKGKLTWQAERSIVDALDAAFYLSFDTIEATGKGTMLALDISGSMGSAALGNVPGLTARDASAALAMVTARTEQNWCVMGFSHNFVQLNVSARQRLDDVIRTISALPFGSTDCSLPMRAAEQLKLPVDVFHVYTDNETYAGHVHPHQALRSFRQKSGRNAKLAVVGMVANGFTIADPTDAGMMDFVGFDTATPAVLADFARS